MEDYSYFMKRGSKANFETDNDYYQRGISEGPSGCGDEQQEGQVDRDKITDDENDIGVGEVEVRDDEEEEEDEDDDSDRPVMALFHGCGSKVGAAVYYPSSAVLAILPDQEDIPPAFNVAIAAVAQLNPCVVVVSGRQSGEFAKAVRELVEDGDSDAENESAGGDEEESLSSDSRPRSRQESSGTTTITVTSRYTALRDARVATMSAKDFSYQTGRNRLLSLRLPSENIESDGNDHDLTSEDHFIYMSSLVDLRCESSVRATGGLLAYLEKHPLGGLDLDRNAAGCVILSIKTIGLEPLVSLDPATMSALQVFNACAQPSGSKAGSWNKTREGLSLFRLLNRCRSSSGSRYLRYLCRCPSSDVDVIRSRQAAVAFLSTPSRTELCETLRNLLGQVKNVPALLKRLSSTQASVTDWKRLKRSVRALLAIKELSCQHGQSVDVFERIREICTDDIYAISSFIEKVFDVEASEQRGRFSIKSGVDESLDERRRIHNGLPDLLHKVAEEEIKDLPDYMAECSVVYVPQIGYMVAVHPWADNLTENDYDLPQLQFMFSAEVPYFKSARCRELDEMLGDTATNIAESETAIMVRLTRYILASTETLLNLAHVAAMLDCLLSLASVAVELDWCRPQVLPRHECDVIDIKSGRHPLLEISSNTVVPNPTKLGGKHWSVQTEETGGVIEGFCKIAMLTGPNACGKSVYLKQVGLIVYLAHLGSWVPAERAVMPAMDAIRTRIQTVDSMSLGLSAFAIDLNQVSQAVRSATAASLLLIDEFGKGTADTDGQALLTACAEHLLQRPRQMRPFVLMTTHFHEVKTSLMEGGTGGGIKFYTFRHTQNDIGDLVFLYQLEEQCGEEKPGAASSKALLVAKKAGVEVVKRGAQVLQILLDGKLAQLKADKTLFPLEHIEETVENFFGANLSDVEQTEEILSKFCG